MDAITMIEERRSVRKFKDKKVDHEVIREIVDISRWAPSWANYQIARYTIIDDKSTIKRLAEEGVNGFSYNIKTLANAPGVAVLSFVKGKSGKLSDDYGVDADDNNTWEIFDAGIACQTFCLAAHAKGVGTCIFGVIDLKAISDIVDLPEGENAAALIVYGYEEGDHAKPTPRMDVDQIVRFIEK